MSETDGAVLCRKLLAHVRADDAYVTVQGAEAGHLRFAANSFTFSGRREDVRVSVTVWSGKKKGEAVGNELDDAALEALVREAQAIAAVSPEETEYVPTLGPQEYRPSARWAEGTAALDAAARARVVSDMIGTCEKDKVVGAGLHRSLAVVNAWAGKNGGAGTERWTQASLSMTARTPEGDGSGYFLRDHEDATKIDAARIARESVARCLRSRGGTPVEPGLYTVLLEPQAVADLLTLMRFAFDARRADEGRSAFSAPGSKTRVGERIFDERVQMRTDPWHPDLPGSVSSDGGLPARALSIVKDGVPTNLVYSRFWAREKQKEPTGGFVNFIVESAARPVSVEEMVKDTKRGLLVTRFWYLRQVDPRTLLYTGLTRDGLWLIENGAVTRPVSNMRFNQSLMRMLAPGNVDAIGAAERTCAGESQGGSAGLYPALKIKEFEFTSASEAV